MVKYISAWTIWTSTLRAELAKAVANSEIQTNDIVWSGPSGDAVIAASPYEIEDKEEYAEYTDSGLVSEYLD